MQQQEAGDHTRGTGLRPPKLEHLQPAYARGEAEGQRTPPGSGGASAAATNATPLGIGRRRQLECKRALPRVLLPTLDHDHDDHDAAEASSCKRRYTAPAGVLQMHDRAPLRRTSSSPPMFPAPPTSPDASDAHSYSTSCEFSSGGSHCSEAPQASAPVATIGVLGHGTFGTTLRQLNTITGAQVAVKRVHRLRADAAAVRALAAHVNALAGFAHPHLFPFLGAAVDPRDGVLCVYAPVCTGRTLAHVLRDFGPAAEVFARRVTQQVVRGLAFLHDACGLAHGDVRGSNVLVESDGRCRLADFALREHLLRAHGAASELNPAEEVDDCPSLPWRAPEVREFPYEDTPAGDVWSVGALVLEMLSDTAAPDAALLRAVAAAPPSVAAASPALLAAVRGCEAAAALVARCCRADARARPDAHALDMTPFLRSDL